MNWWDPEFHARLTVLESARRYLVEAVRMDTIHRLSMIKITTFYAPLAALMILVYGDYPADLLTLDFWWRGSDLRMIMLASLPVVGISFVLNILIALRMTRKLPHRLVAFQVYKIEMQSSARAGFFEELVYRWMTLLVFIPPLELLNFVAGGNSGTGLLERAHATFFGPLGDIVSYGLLEPQLMGDSWSLALAILVSQALFTKGHYYQGLAGAYFSWLMSFGFFYLTFNHGLLTAMAAHAVANAAAHSIVLADTYWDTRNMVIKD